MEFGPCYPGIPLRFIPGYSQVIATRLQMAGEHAIEAQHFAQRAQLWLSLLIPLARFQRGINGLSEVAGGALQPCNDDRQAAMRELPW
jgi:hypothetical protein